MHVSAVTSHLVHRARAYRHGAARRPGRWPFTACHRHGAGNGAPVTVALPLMTLPLPRAVHAQDPVRVAGEAAATAMAAGVVSSGDAPGGSAMVTESLRTGLSRHAASPRRRADLRGRGRIPSGGEYRARTGGDGPDPDSVNEPSGSGATDGVDGADQAGAEIGGPLRMTR